MTDDSKKNDNTPVTGQNWLSKALPINTVLGVLVMVIISLCGTIIFLKDSSINDQIDKKVKVAIECAVANLASAATVDKLSKDSAASMEKLDREKLGLDVYIADQKRQIKSDESLKESLNKIDKNVDMLIRLQIQGKKTGDIDRKTTEDWRDKQTK